MMASWMTKIFGGSSDNSAKSVNEKAVSGRILKNLLDRHSPIMISFPDSPEQYLSRVIDVDFQGSRLILNEFSPKEGHAKAISGATFYASASDQGVGVSFKTNVLEEGTENGIAFYKVAFPTSLEYKRRREGFRIKILPGTSSSVQITFANAENLSADLVDLSFSGLRFSIEGQSPFELNLGDNISLCQFEILKDFVIKSKAEICFLSFDEKKRQTLIGCRFLEMSESSQRLVNQAVLALQREEIRRENGE